MMMRTTFVRGVVLLAAVTAAAGAETHHAQAAGALTPILQLHARTTARDGGVFQSATATAPFVPGVPVILSATAGTSRPSEMTLCGGGVGGDRPIQDLLKQSSFVWKITLIPVKQVEARVIFDLEWARYQADSPARPVMQGMSTLTLAEGQRQVIDLAHGAAGSSRCGAESTVIEVGAAVQEEPKLAAAILQYDLWLTHQAPGGAKQVRHFTGMGTQGAEIAFAFLPLRFQLQPRTPSQATYDVITSVKGTLRGRLQDDGRIALTVDTSRRDGLGPRGEAAAGDAGNSGVKRLEVGESEAVEIELPATGGSSSIPVDTGARTAPAPGTRPPTIDGVTVADGRIRIDHAQFFAGQRTALVLQVKEVR
jgi:hypothetical protein